MKLVDFIESLGEENYYIYVSMPQLLKPHLFFWAVFFGLNIFPLPVGFWVANFPLFLIWGVFTVWYCRIWQRFGYHRVMYYIVVLCGTMLSLVLAKLVCIYIVGRL